jgi:hypothetical protein
MKVRQLKRRKGLALRQWRRDALSGKGSSSKKHRRVGIARGKFEVPDSIDADDAEILRLFLGNNV